MNIQKLKFNFINSFNKSYLTDLNILTFNTKQILNSINIFNYINQLLKLKNNYIDKISISFLNKSLIVNIYLYYGSLKFFFFKKYLKSKIINNNLQKFKINIKNNLFPTNFIKLNKVKDITIKYTILNKNIKIFKSLILYKKIKPIISTLLKKKKYLLLDFIKLTILLIDNKITVKLFTLIIGRIFAILSKKNHNRFFLIIKKIFIIIINKTIFKNTNIQGLKLKLSGRLRGKTRSDTRNITIGSIPLQTKSKFIEYYKQHVYTIYGAFGLKIWLYRLI